MSDITVIIPVYNVENYLKNDDDLSDKTWAEIRESYNLKINDSTIQKGYDAIKK